MQTHHPGTYHEAPDPGPGGISRIRSGPDQPTSGSHRLHWNGEQLRAGGCRGAPFRDVRLLHGSPQLHPGKGRIHHGVFEIRPCSPERARGIDGRVSKEEGRRKQVMNRLEFALKELSLLESDLKKTVNQIWSLKLRLSSAYSFGHMESDFLPRRIQARIYEEQREFERLVVELRHVLSFHLGSAFIPLSSAKDLKTVRSLRTTIRYIKNAYTDEPHLLEALARLNRPLASSSTSGFFLTLSPKTIDTSFMISVCFFYV